MTIKKEELGVKDWIYLGFSLIHTTSKAPSIHPIQGHMGAYSSCHTMKGGVHLERLPVCCRAKTIYTGSNIYIDRTNIWLSVPTTSCILTNASGIIESLRVGTVFLGLQASPLFLQTSFCHYAK